MIPPALGGSTGLAGAATYLFSRISGAQIGGQTGDTLGACQQIAAIAFLMAMLRRVSLLPFVLYRMALGGFLLVLLYG